ncbi:sensor histidine kinase [Acuticoccus sp.]|uniref:sensor histidine kinase n=1 Tax=Acuticoccus sp. TaxID=1904378 RepID=UPI003B51C596
MVLEQLPVAVAISDPNAEDNPIIYANPAFTKLTGYEREAVIGRNCRFLQGDETEADAIAELRAGLHEGRGVAAELLNYRADGTPFRNRLVITPLHDAEGRLTHFVGLQRAVEQGPTQAASPEVGTDDALREIHHRVKNHLSMVIGMIRLQARGGDAASAEGYSTLARRIETLQLLYDEMTTGGTRDASDRRIPLGAYVSRIASAIAYLDGRDGLQLNLDLAHVKVPMDVAARVGLLTSELLTNAYQHAFPDHHEGTITVRLAQVGDGLLRLTVSDDGVGLPATASWPQAGGLGGKIVSSLVSGLGAELSTIRGRRGTTFAIDLPEETASVVDGGRHGDGRIKVADPRTDGADGAAPEGGAPQADGVSHAGLDGEAKAS